MDGEVWSWVVEAEGFRVDVDLDELRGGIPFRCVPEMQDPVQTGTEEENDICFGEGGAACGGGVQWMGIREDAFAHGGGEEGDMRVGDESAD